MGREASCTCRWGDREVAVKALLEPGELLLRGDLRARIALDTLERTLVCGDALELLVGGERIALVLGAVRAAAWAKAIAKPAPSLAHKLGITAATHIHLSGNVDDEALREALGAGASRGAISLAEADLAIVRTDDADELRRSGNAVTRLAATPPVWVVYAKGRDARLGETGVRETMRQLGFIDTKVAAVSARLSALRFTRKRRNERAR